MKKGDFKNLLQGIKEVGLIRAKKLKPSRVFDYKPNLKVIRKKFKMSQSQFADLIGVSIFTLRNWEQGRTEPDGAARSLLTVAEKRPKAVFEALHG
ncbi:MAG: helix-turn-helix domain-containing protein [Candidatus Aureabacteria bacterium]|nr:helix-turn-helix domain-containing protein [Candidatus Auribacterota bacterium]